MLQGEGWFLNHNRPAATPLGARKKQRKKELCGGGSDESRDKEGQSWLKPPKALRKPPKARGLRSTALAARPRHLPGRLRSKSETRRCGAVYAVDTPYLGSADVLVAVLAFPAVLGPEY